MLTLGPFQVTPDGALSPRAPGLRPVLRYAWRGRDCAAEVTGDSLRLVALAGRIPSTARRGHDRGEVVAALSRIRGSLPDGLRLHLLADHRVVVRGEDRLADRPVGIYALVGGMVRFALALDPLLDELAGAGVN